MVTLAELERVSFRRCGRARVLHCGVDPSRAPTVPHVFVAPSYDELVQQLAAYFGGAQ